MLLALGIYLFLTLANEEHRRMLFLVNATENARVVIITLASRLSWARWLQR